MLFQLRAMTAFVKDPAMMRWTSFNSKIFWLVVALDLPFFAILCVLALLWHHTRLKMVLVLL
jgi:hypothetical protein